MLGGDKVKEQKEESERQSENNRYAGSSYTSPEFDTMDTEAILSGLPWGGINMRHICETGRKKEQSSMHNSRANSIHADVASSRRENPQASYV